MIGILLCALSALVRRDHLRHRRGLRRFTIVTTNWRTRFRREMNVRDNEFSAPAVDGLINYEVVKAFANEGYEAGRLDRSLAAYERAAVQSRDRRWRYLNAGQAAIIAIGVTAIMIVGRRATSSPARSASATSCWSTPSSSSSTSRSTSWAWSIASCASP